MATSQASPPPPRGIISDRCRSVQPSKGPIKVLAPMENELQNQIAHTITTLRAKYRDRGLLIPGDFSRAN